jgi:predicted HTH transcriptional regulator
MALTHIPIEQITEAHLVSLIDTKAPEALHIEYKQQSYGANDQARREFLADVSSIANSRGGDLLIGVAASKGVPTTLSPLTDADAEVLRLDNMARSRIGAAHSKLSNSRGADRWWWIGTSGSYTAGSSPEF